MTPKGVAWQLLCDPIPLPKANWASVGHLLHLGQSPSLGNLEILFTWLDLSGAVSSHVAAPAHPIEGREGQSGKRTEQRQRQKQGDATPGLLSQVKSFPASGCLRFQVPCNQFPILESSGFLVVKIAS